MADEENKQVPPSSSSSSSQPHLDRSLVQVFGALEQTLNDLTSSVQANTGTLQEVVRAVQTQTDSIEKVRKRGRLDDQQRAAILNTLTTLTNGVAELTKQGNLTLDTAVTVRKELEVARKELNAASDQLEERLEEVTGSHPLLDPEGLPGPLQKAWLAIGNVGWKNKAKVVAWVTAGGLGHGYGGVVLTKIKMIWLLIVGG